MTTSPLRVGFIGANGLWGPSAHAPALAKLPETEIYAVCTAHADTAQAAADKYGVKHAYSDVKTMGADPQVEAALVAVRVAERRRRPGVELGGERAMARLEERPVEGVGDGAVHRHHHFGAMRSPGRMS